MKKVFIGSLIGFLACSAISAQAADQDVSALKAAIITLDRQGWDAWKNNDASWFRDNTTDEFLSISADGMSTKAQVLAAIPAECRVTAVSLDHFTFVMLDDNAVLLTYVATQDAICGGKQAPASVRAAVNYVKRGGRWLEAMYMQTP